MADLTAHQAEWVRQIIAEVERAFPAHVAAYPDDSWWQPIGPVQQCECCGTPVFPLEDHVGARRWCQVGELPRAAGSQFTLAFHTPDRCRYGKERANA